MLEWREAVPMEYKWRDAFENVIEQLSEQWELGYPTADTKSLDILLMAYPAARHLDFLEDPKSLEKIANLPILPADGQLILLACGQASPAVSEDDVVQISASTAISNSTACSVIRPMRLHFADEDTLLDSITRRLLVLSRMGVAVRAVSSSPGRVGHDFTANEHLDF